MLYAVFNLLSKLILLYTACFIVRFVLEMLMHFNVIRSSTPRMAKFYSFLFKITEPLLKPIRKFMPRSLDMDISPLVVIFALLFLRDFLQGTAMETMMM